MFRLLIETDDVDGRYVREFVMARLREVVEALNKGETLGDIRIGQSPQARVGSYMLEEED